MTGKEIIPDALRNAVSLDREVRLRMDTVAAEDGIEWLYIFTNEEESHKKPVPNVVMEITL